MKMPFSAATLWKYNLLILTSVITCVDVIFISCGVVALGITGSVISAYIAASIGILIMSIAFVGAMASVRRAVMMSWAFVAMSVASIILQTIFMIIFAVTKDDFSEMTAKRIANIWENKTANAERMYKIQIQYQCCGKESPQDYLQDDDDVLPKSCCRYENCAEDANIYGKGCLGTALRYFDTQSDNLILLLVGIIALQILGVVAAYYMARSIKIRVEKRERIIINE